MPKNLLVFSDGTGQAGGVRPDQRASNIYKLYRATRVDPANSIDPEQQVAFYDAGLGTDDDVGGSLFRTTRWFKKVTGSITGRGITSNIIDCYEFILNHWEEGDRIYLMGFSRGAYTARCVANVLSLCGVPTHDKDGTPVPRFQRRTRAIASEAVKRVYEHGAGRPRATYEAEREEQGRRFRSEYGSANGDAPNASPYFIGVFDTVASLGSRGLRRAALTLMLAAIFSIPIYGFSWAVGAIFDWKMLPTFLALSAAVAGAVWVVLYIGSIRSIRDFPSPGDPVRRHRIRWEAANYDRSLSAHVMYARHAISIDETRSDFPRVKWGNAKVIRKKVAEEPEPLIQLWFAGNHSDIGGSYPENESRLSDIALKWMVEEARSIPFPVLFNAGKLHLYPSAVGLQHCEAQAVRDRYLYWVPRWAPAWARQGWGEKVRIDVFGATLHQSVYERFAAKSVACCGRASQYRPPALSKDERFASYYLRS